MTRQTLNGRQPRTLRDASRDPFDWIDGPHRGDVHRIGRIGDRAIAVIAAACAAAILVPALLHGWARVFGG